MNTKSFVNELPVSRLSRRALLVAAAAPSLGLALSACGGGAEPHNEPGVGATAPSGPGGGGAAPFTVSSITPPGGPAGTRVVVAGAGFGAGVTVAVDGVPAAIETVSSTELRAVVGASTRRGPVDVRVALGNSAVTLAGGFWMTASGLPGNDPALEAAGVPPAIRNQTIWSPVEVVRPEYGYQPWLAMIAPRGSSSAVAFVDSFELVVRLPGAGERVVTRDDFGIESSMRSRAWGELLWRNPWGRSSGYRESYLQLAPATSPTMLVMDQARAPAGLGDALYFHSWTRDWELDPTTGRDIGRANIPYAVPAGSQLVLRAAFRTRGRALFQFGLDRYATRSGSDLIELALSDYHMNESDTWQTASLAIDVRS